MKSILGVVFFIFPFSGITACENIRFNEAQKNEEVFMMCQIFSSQRKVVLF